MEKDSLMSKNKRSPAAFARPADYDIQPEDSPYAQALPLKLNQELRNRHTLILLRRTLIGLLALTVVL